jgi:hypothetical protein
MHHLRLVIIAVATICVLALGVFAFVNSPGSANPPGGDDIIIKGGSMEIQCGSNHGNDCLGTHDATGKYKHKKDKAHIRRIVIKDVTGKEYDQYFTVDDKGKGEIPTIVITYN